MAKRLTDHDRMLRNVSEAQFQSQVQRVLTATGWSWYHAPDNKPMNGHIQDTKAGFPDLVCWRGPSIMYMELKSMVGRLSPAQDECIQGLRDAGQAVYVFRPSDMEEITALLKRTRSDAQL